ncbi:MAG TPA: hypothetical protein VFV39_06465 [Limnobacter sp.]|nr:hypothetical protein [Limnobacter sp.]
MDIAQSLIQTPIWPTPKVEGGETYEQLALNVVRALKLARDVVESYLDGLGNAERSKAQHAIQQMNEYIEKLEKQRNLNGLQKFLKALGPIGLILAAIMAFVAPSPITIALLVVAVAMFLEPMISKAAGADSMIEQGMMEIFNALESVMGPVGAAVMAAVLFLVLAVVATSAVATGLSAFSSLAASTTQALVQTLRNLPQTLGRAFTSSLNPDQTRQLQLFLEVAQSAILATQSGVQIDMALINFQLAQLMHAYGLEQAVVDEWSRIIQMLTNDLGQAQELIDFLRQLLPELFDQGHIQ